MKSLIICAGCFIAISLLYFDYADSQDSLNLELIGKAAPDGYLSCYLTIDNYLYIGSNYGNSDSRFIGNFTIIDVSDPARPARNLVDYDSGAISGFLIVDSLLYISRLDGGLAIYNIQDTAEPVEAASFAYNFGCASPMRRYGDYIISIWGRRCSIIDISDRMNPRTVSAIEHSAIDLYDIALYEHYLFISSGNFFTDEYYIDIYDISDPDSPSLVSTIPIEDPWFGSKLKFVGNYLYLYNAIIGIRIYYVGDPLNPLLITTKFTEYDVTDILVDGNTMYFSSLRNSIFTVDITDPIDPIITNEFSVQSVQGVDWRILRKFEDRLCYLSIYDIIAFLDVSDPNSPQPLGSYFAGTTAQRRSARWNGYLYTGQMDHGIKIIDMTDPKDPIGIRCYKSMATEYCLLVDNGILYCGDNRTGILVFSLDDPLYPDLVSSIPLHAGIICLYISENYVYATMNLGYYIADISDPYDPQLIAEYISDDPYTCFNSITVQGDYAYTGENQYGIGIYDISDRSDPVKISSYGDIPGHSVFIRDNLLFAGWPGISILDISDPENPSMVGSAGNEEVMDMHVDGDVAYLATRNCDFRAYDISNPTSPELIGIYPEIGSSSAINFESDTLFVSTTQEGIWILRPEEASGTEDPHQRPSQVSLNQNYPNPFNASTTISYTLPEKGDVAISIYNLLGQRVATVLEGIQVAGEHSITWDATDFPSGVYFARLEAGDRSENIKMVLLK